MTRPRQFKEELELDALLATEEELRQKELEFTRSQQRIERERSEREVTMPPLEEVRIRERERRHQEIVTCGEVANVRRTQSRSLLMLLLLLVATGSLIWWGLQLMKGG